MATHIFGLLVENLDPNNGPGNFTVTITSDYTTVGSFCNFAGTLDGRACGDYNADGEAATIGGYASHIAWALYLDTTDDTFSGTVECEGITQDTTISWDNNLNAATIPANTASFPFSLPTSDSSSTAEELAARRKTTSPAR